MFARFAIVGLVLVAAVPAAGQDAYDPSAKYWPLAKISFPVDLDKVASANPRPVSLRFYAAPPRGKFEMVAEKKVDELEEIDDVNSRGKRRGFNYTSRNDGRIDFALQYVFANGETAPAAANLAAQYKIVFDTRQPLARIATTGPRSVKWTVEDENLLASSIKLEVRSAGGTNWTTVTTREFGPADAYTWAPFDRNRVLEVRVSGKDRAGHEGVSNIVRIGGDGGAGGVVNDPIGPRGPGAGGSVGTGFGGPDDFPNRPQIEYVNDSRLTVRTKPTKVTRSGITQANLWMKEQTGQWQVVATKKDVNITADDVNKPIEIPYDTKKDGLFHFIVQPINGAGQKPADPRDGDPAHWIVEVDMVPPKVDLRGAKAVPGGLNGPRVEIDYQITEKNLMPDPITLEYSADPAKNVWTPIASKVPNTGKYVWEIEDRTLWKFHLRVKAEDRAGNVGLDVSKTEVTVDLETPAAIIERIDKAGGGPGGVKKSNYSPQEHTNIPVGTPLPPPVPQPEKKPDPAPLPPIPEKKPDPLPVPAPPTPEKKPDPLPLPAPKPLEAPKPAPMMPELPKPALPEVKPPMEPKLPPIGELPGGIPLPPPPGVPEPGK